MENWRAISLGKVSYLCDVCALHVNRSPYGAEQRKITDGEVFALLNVKCSVFNVAHVNAVLINRSLKNMEYLRWNKYGVKYGYFKF